MDSTAANTRGRFALAQHATAPAPAWLLPRRSAVRMTRAHERSVFASPSAMAGRRLSRRPIRATSPHCRTSSAGRPGSRRHAPANTSRATRAAIAFSVSPSRLRAQLPAKVQPARGRMCPGRRDFDASRTHALTGEPGGEVGGMLEEVRSGSASRAQPAGGAQLEPPLVPGPPASYKLPYDGKTGSELRRVHSSISEVLIPAASPLARQRMATGDGVCSG